jgi:hypothetical protein
MPRKEKGYYTYSLRLEESNINKEVNIYKEGARSPSKSGYEMLKLIIQCTWFEVMIIVVQVGAVKIYAAALEALR